MVILTEAGISEAFADVANNLFARRRLSRDLCDEGGHGRQNRRQQTQKGEASKWKSAHRNSELLSLEPRGDARIVESVILTTAPGNCNLQRPGVGSQKSGARNARFRLLTPASDSRLVSLYFPAISFSISSTARGRRRVSSSLPSGVMRMSSSMRTPIFSSGR